MQALGTPERAAGTKKYLKSDLNFLGATMPQVREMVREFARGHPDLDRAELITIVEELWNKPIFELRISAVVLLQSYASFLGPRDLVLIERLLRESLTWALVDPLAVDVVGRLALEHPAILSRLNRWAEDPDFWLRRSALLALMPGLKKGGDLGRFFDYADSMLEEKEFFIRKAIGWVLREVSKTRPEPVCRWLAPRAHRASGVTMREATKYLGDRSKKELLAAYRDKRPLDAALC